MTATLLAIAETRTDLIDPLEPRRQKLLHLQLGRCAEKTTRRNGRTVYVAFWGWCGDSDGRLDLEEVAFVEEAAYATDDFRPGLQKVEIHSKREKYLPRYFSRRVSSQGVTFQ